MKHLFSIASALVLITADGLAQSPALNYAVPSAAPPGKTTTVVFFGDNLAGATELWASFPTTTPTAVSGTNFGKITGQLSLPKNVPVGIGAVRVATTNGISSLQLFMIDDLPTLADIGTNKTMATAQELKWPVAVEGTCEELSYDYYAFTAKKGERISVEVVAQRLGSLLDPVTRLLDARGKELVYCDDEPGIGADCRFAYSIPASGKYFIEIRDLSYQGGPKYRYRLRVGGFPVATVPIPLGVQQGTKAEVTFIGSAVDGVRPVSVTIPRETPDKQIHLSARNSRNQGSGFVRLVTGALAEVLESEPNDQPETSTKLIPPVAINGRFAKPNDRDFFQFEAAKGERLLLTGATRSLGSPCDLSMRLYKADGVQLAEANIAGANEGTLTNTFNEAGTYRLLIEELNHRGGPDLGYRVEIQPYRPGFALSVETEKVEAAAGGNFEIKVTCARREYDGPITLSLAGLGEDFVIENNVIPEKKNEVLLKANLPANCEPGRLLHPRIVGKARIGDADYETVASTVPALRKLFPLMLFPPVQFDGLIGLGTRSSATKTVEEKPRKGK